MDQESMVFEGIIRKLNIDSSDDKDLYFYQP